MEKIYKLSISNIINIEKRHFEKVPYDNIPDVMDRNENKHQNYYWHLYKVRKVNDEKIEIRMTDIYSEDVKILSFLNPIKKTKTLVNLHIPTKVMICYKRHLFWKVENSNNKKLFYLIKASEDEYSNYCIENFKKKFIVK